MRDGYMVIYLNTFDPRRPGERGGVLLLVALSLVALLGFIALAIDSARVMTAQTEKLYTADHAATAGLEAYLEREPAPEALASASDTNARNLLRHQFKVGEALSRIAEISSENRTTFIQGSELLNPAEINSLIGSANVRFGRWWRERPANCASDSPACPCGPGMDPSQVGVVKPCFQPCSIEDGCVGPDGSTDMPFASALEVTLKSKPKQGVAMTFARVLGVTDDRHVSGTAYANANSSVAYALPKVGVLLVDLSRATTIDNYPPFEREPDLPSEFSFELREDPANNLASCNGSLNPCGATCKVKEEQEMRRPEDTHPLPPTMQTSYQTIYNSLSNKGDYTCHQLKLGGVTSYHLVNTGGEIAEPYGSLLRGVNTTLLELRKNSNAADYLSVIGFDHQTAEEREYPRGKSFISSVDADFDELLQATGDRLLAAKAGFFPRANSRADLANGLQRAFEKLSKNLPLSQIDPYIMLFSNGLSMCEGVTSPGTRRCGRLSAAADLPGVQTQLFERHTLAMEEALGRVATSYYKPNKIKVHVFPAGLTTPAHSALIQRPDGGGCLSDREIRRYRLFNIIGYENMDDAKAAYKDLASAPGKTFAQPMMYLYSLSTLTQGEWLPVRKECPSLTAMAADTLCSGSTAINTTALPGPDERIVATRASAYRPPTGGEEIDAEGRLLCTPRGGMSQPEQQIAEAVKRAIERRPVMLVTPNV